MMVWYMYILCSDHHDKFRWHTSPHTVTEFLVMSFKIYSLREERKKEGKERGREGREGGRKFRKRLFS